MNNNDDFNFIDRFLYKFLICTIMLVMVVIGSKLKLINLEGFQKDFGYHLNILPVLSWINGEEGVLLPIEITDEVSLTTRQSYQNSSVIKNGRQVNLNEMQGVENYKDGVVVKIFKNSDDTFEVTIQGMDNLEYIYDKLASVDVNMYKFVSSGEIIGSPNTKNSITYFNFYVYDRSEVINLFP